VDIAADTPIADIAARHPRSVEVFERHGIDFCCGGRRPLGEACREHGIAVDTLTAEVQAATARETPQDRVFNDGPLGTLLDHIVARYHAALREDLPHLSRLADKVAEVHGARHPELSELARVYQELRRDVSGALHALEEEHDRAGAALTRLRELSRGFAVPEDGCPTYRALYEGLVRFERELHEHVHLENNVLFPRVVSLAR
jgi:regulator of cell morphogenesis and NO signaling